MIDVFTSEYEVALRLLCGMAAGVVVGWERTVRQSVAGIRTFGLVGLGTATAAAIFAGSAEGDEASRVVQGVLTGVGFLGAGVITVINRAADRNGDGGKGQVAANSLGGAGRPAADPGPPAGPSGLTTAAAVWVTAALGCAAGLGDYKLAGVGAALALVLLLIDHSVERLAGRRR